MESREAGVQEERPIILVMEARLSSQECLEIRKKGTLIWVPPSIGVAVVDGEFGVGFDMQVRLDIHTPRRTELEVVCVRVPDPFISVSKDTEAHVVRADVWKVSLNKPGVSQVKGVGFGVAA